MIQLTANDSIFAEEFYYKVAILRVQLRMPPIAGEGRPDFLNYGDITGDGLEEAMVVFGCPLAALPLRRTFTSSLVEID